MMTKTKYQELDDKEWVDQRYNVERLSTYAIAEILGCCEATVRNALIKFCFSRRTVSEALSGKTLPEETRRKISESNKGRIVTEETKRKISEGNKGKIHTEEAKRKMSEALKGRDSPMKGKRHTEETRRKLSEANKGKPSPMKGKTHTEEAKRKMSEKLSGANNPHLGKHHSIETKHKISEANRNPSDVTRGRMSESAKRRGISKETRIKINESLKGRRHSEATKKKMSDTHKGKIVTEETKKRMSEAARIRQRKLWADEYYREMMLPRLREGIKKVHQNEEAQRKRFKSLVKKPNAPEQILIGIINKHNLPYKYTGNGEFVLGGKCPDFINTNGKKEVIEVFGRVFHSPLFTFRKTMPYHQTYEGTIEHYKKYGFKCRIFWDTDVMRADAEQFILTQLGVSK